jgi:preprotein translocase subunit SecF
VRFHRSIPLLRLLPDDTKFDFMRFRRISFPLSALASIFAMVLYFSHGLNFGIDFVGGTLLEVQSKTEVADLARMRTTLGGLGLGEVQLQQFGTPGDEVTYRQEAVVGPRISTELLAYSAIGLMTAIFGILVYLWFRFEWQFALGAMVANVHDLVLTIGFMSLFQIDFDLASIAALLTILGYSLNDTVVIYDRIREMLRRYKRMPIPELLNASINSTMTRSVNTHVTVTLALLAMYFFGGHAIHSFTATMLFGVVLVGTYTSVFIAAPLLIYFGVGSFRSSATEEEPEPEPAAARKRA